MPGFESIDGLTVTETVARALAAAGITTPTPVQAEAVGAVLAGRHVLLHSGTGTGKTLGYLLPVLQLLRANDGHRAVVFAPGTELAMQTLRVADAVRDEAITTAPAVATSSARRQRDRLQRSTRLVVGTPDRLVELFRTGKLRGTRIVVFDELEVILTSPATAFLDELLVRSEPKLQLVVATATMGPRSVAFVDRWMPDAVRVQPAADPLRHDITHGVVRVPRGQGKEVALARFVEQRGCRRAIVFVNDPHQQSHLYRYLGQHRLSAVTVGREGTKAQRQQSLDAFRRGDARVLLTSDAVARGLDVPDVPWVLHYDLPASAEAYVHRAGRTGRAGKSGASVVFVEDEGRGQLHHLARELGIEFVPERR
ncbi:MAG: DEAD/DEAH box helicase [Myxococcota bacterium]